MLTNEEILAAATQSVSDEDLRSLIDAELGDNHVPKDSLHLLLAADALCDAAMEVAADQFGAQKIKKTFVLGDVKMDFADLAIVADIQRNVESGNVSEDEIDALLLRSSVAGAISQALEGGVSEEDLSDSQIQITSVSLSNLKRPRRKGLFSRLLGRHTR